MCYVWPLRNVRRRADAWRLVFLGGECAYTERQRQREGGRRKDQDRRAKHMYNIKSLRVVNTSSVSRKVSAFHQHGASVQQDKISWQRDRTQHAERTMPRGGKLGLPGTGHRHFDWLRYYLPWLENQDGDAGKWRALCTTSLSTLSGVLTMRKGC